MQIYVGNKEGNIEHVTDYVMYWKKKDLNGRKIVRNGRGMEKGTLWNIYINFTYFSQKWFCFIKWTQISMKTGYKQVKF